MRRTAVASVLFATLCNGVVSAQLSFEVASIRPSTRKQPAPLPSSPDQLVRAGFTLRQLVMSAFDRDEYTVFGGPDWIQSARFDVTAKADRAVTHAEMQEMTRRLLEERFALKTHTEMRDLDVFALVLARGDGTLGPSLKKSSLDCTPFVTGVRPMSESPRAESGVRLLCVPFAVIAGGATMMFRGAPLMQVAERLQDFVRRPIVDRTGLPGTFDFDLKFTADSVAVQREGFPSLMTALEEQLGLRLQSRKEPIEVLVIDDAQPPTPN
jgi:uncharacterized protein (TIGR03435 family)